MVNSWRTHGKLIENSLKIDGKLMERSWKTQGKPMENVWEIHGKLMEISWKTHASFLDLPLDAQNCSQMFRIALRCSELCPESKNCRNLFKQILTMVAKSFELERASRSHAKTGSLTRGMQARSSNAGSPSTQLDPQTLPRPPECSVQSPCSPTGEVATASEQAGCESSRS